jgi:hypothetical protein
MDDYLPGDQTERILTGGETALRVWRERRGLALAELAAASQIPLDRLCELDAGRGWLDDASADRLAAALGLPRAWIEREVYEE